MLHSPEPTVSSSASVRSVYSDQWEESEELVMITRTARMSSNEDIIMAIPRELTQNPLRKIWMPCKNGLPEKHIFQKKGMC